MNRKFELWSDYYHKSGIRHLFIEQPYFTGKFLNLWMKTDSDDILNMVYDNLEGTMAHHLMVKEYYKKIKEQCPETIFHGTDVGHQYDTTGQEYLTYLEDNNLGGSEQYKLTKENI